MFKARGVGGGGLGGAGFGFGGAGAPVPGDIGPGPGGGGDCRELLQLETPTTAARSSIKTRVFMAFTSLEVGFYSRARNLLSSSVRQEQEGTSVKWMSAYLIGYFIFLAGVALALWKIGILASIGSTWALIGLVIAVGIGIMISVTNSGEKKTIDVDRN
jgi:hypothetical protein